MSDVLQQIWAGTKLIILFGGSGMWFAFGVAAVCRWLKWAPINITVNVNQNPSPTPTEDAG